MAGRALHSYTLVFVCHFHVVDPYISAPDIDTVKSSLITASNDHVIDLAISASIHSEVECGGCRLVSRYDLIFDQLTINQRDIMGREVCNTLEAQNSRAICTSY